MNQRGPRGQNRRTNRGRVRAKSTDVPFLPTAMADYGGGAITDEVPRSEAAKAAGRVVDRVSGGVATPAPTRHQLEGRIRRGRQGEDRSSWRWRSWWWCRRRRRGQGEGRGSRDDGVLATFELEAEEDQRELKRGNRPSSKGQSRGGMRSGREERVGDPVVTCRIPKDGARGDAGRHGGEGTGGRGGEGKSHQFASIDERY